MPIRGGFREIGEGRTRGRLDIPFGAYMPEEYSEELFQQLEARRQREEGEATRRFIEEINALGRLHTGGALRGGIERVLGPSIERRQELLGEIAMRGPMLGREERLGELDFQRQRQFAGEEFGRKRQFAQEEHIRTLARMQQAYEIRRQLAELEEELAGGGFGQFMGGLTGQMLGGMAGGFGGAAGGAAGRWAMSGRST